MSIRALRPTEAAGASSTTGFLAFAVRQLLARRHLHPLMLAASLAFVVHFALGG